ncbi:formylglycine-generating enzyme family protein [Colwellia sp. 75C3]|uniref:formylglycine-generating enzyme family protein n=1 Tax=Colwellia sp. 75C3 TaxID=888425 RepID=UPI0012FEDEF2|nr:formylglycine-generating enzyme family protein [Colwellia sp. 75C3]
MQLIKIKYLPQLCLSVGVLFFTTNAFAVNEPEMVAIKGGCFQMGSKVSEREQPIHKVCVKDFYMGKHEVTFAQYDEYARATGKPIPEDEGWGRGNRPVINVSFDDARSYARWLGKTTRKRYRIPSEAQWEYAARGGTTSRWFWGNEDFTYDTFANCKGGECGDSYTHTSPVGSFMANPYGLYDMAGNVWEWTNDCWNSTYENAPNDGSSWLDGDCENRVIRGGSWGDSVSNLRSADRHSVTRDERYLSLGFRLAQDKQ